MSLKSLAYFLIIIICAVVILIYGQSLIIPFLLGSLLWFMVRELKRFLGSFHFVKNRIPDWVIGIASPIVILLVVFAVFNVLSNNINNLSTSYEKYQANIDSVIAQINATFNMNLFETVQGHLGNLNFGELLSALFNSLSGLVGNTFMIVIYSLFVLFEESNFQAKLKNIFVDDYQYQWYNTILKKIENSISKYFRLKALVSLITGFLSFIVLWLIGVDSPAFWAFLIFVLNFIPTIGSLVATLFPAIFCLLQFGYFWPSLLVLVLVGSIQLIVGNIIEPRLMGSSMNISPLVTILSLSFWGLIWGVTGMILSVPITVVMIIIFSQFEKTRMIAVLLSEKGNIEQISS